jgi:leucyl/phenylalanyl-tRNA--protein transferase
VTGQELTPWLIRYAYEQGVFPMTMDDDTVEWFRPHQRALFPLSGIHISHSLQRTLNRREYEVRFDTSFEAVMRGCFRPDGNWISEDFVRVYSEIFRQGWAHCSEAWHEGELCGGVYGIALGSCFCAESMFHQRTDASKVALAALVGRCRESGFTIFDAQIMNPHLASLGAFEVPNEEYQEMLAAALRLKK